MTPEKISPLVSRLGALPYFPSIADIDARISIARVLHQCAGENLDRIEWTVNRCLAIWDKWEGPHELRAVMCSRWRPSDGVEAYSRLPQFADGIPSAEEGRNQELIGAAELNRLPPGEALRLISEARTLEPAPRPRDKVDAISEQMDRDRSIKHATAPTDAEIESLKSQQDRNRRES